MVTSLVDLLEYYGFLKKLTIAIVASLLYFPEHLSLIVPDLNDDPAELKE